MIESLNLFFCFVFLEACASARLNFLKARQKVVRAIEKVIPFAITRISKV